MRKTALLLAAMSFMAAPAYAATFVDNFDTENGGASALNYTGFANFTVVGQVDLVKSGDFGITCSGLCVDLDGTSGPGGLLSGLFNYNAGDFITLSFLVGGSQRIANGVDDFSVVILTDTGDDFFDSFNLGSGDPFQAYSHSFTASGNGALRFAFGTDSADNIGPLIDNISLNIAPVPEPATWAMMVGGLALAGAALRRRKTNVSFA